VSTRVSEALSQLRGALWWIVPLALVVALLGWETDFGHALRRSPAPLAAHPGGPVTASMLPDFEISGGLASRTQTIDRPLFTPTRRPAPPAVIAAPKSAMQRGQFALTGTFMIDGQNAAILREINGGRSRRVLQGDTINGLTVATVGADRVRLTQGDESEELLLRVATNPKATVQPVAAVAPQTTTAVAAPGSAQAMREAAIAAEVPPPAPVAVPRTEQDVRRDLRRQVRQAASAYSQAAELTGQPPEGENPNMLPPPNLPPGMTWDPRTDPYRNRWPAAPKK